ncbi:MAG: M56 family metallopeptidase [Bacillota bacterium]
MINHTYIVYSFVGSFLAVLFIYILNKLNLQDNPRERAVHTLILLGLPVASYVLYVLILNKPCTINFLTEESFLAKICSLGYFLADLLLPFFLLVAVAALFKTLLSLIYANHLVKKYRGLNNNSLGIVNEQLEELSLYFKIDQPEVIIIPALRAKAFVFGFGNKYLVLSKGLLEILDQEELTLILAHELYHIKRKDNLTNWFSLLLRDLMFFNPLAHWLYKNHQIEKEKSADQAALLVHNKPAVLAEVLLKLWKNNIGKDFRNGLIDSLNPYPSFFAGVDTIEARVKNALNYMPSGLPVKPRVNVLNWLAIILVAVILVLIC